MNQTKDLPSDMRGGVRETLLGLVDSVAALAKMEASIAVFRAELIVRAGEWAILAEDPAEDLSGLVPGGWSPKERVKWCV